MVYFLGVNCKVVISFRCILLFSCFIMSKGLGLEHLMFVLLMVEIPFSTSFDLETYINSKRSKNNSILGLLNWERKSLLPWCEGSPSFSVKKIKYISGLVEKSLLVSLSCPRLKKSRTIYLLIILSIKEFAFERNWLAIQASLYASSYIPFVLQSSHVDNRDLNFINQCHQPLTQNHNLGCSLGTFRCILYRLSGMSFEFLFHLTS